MNDKAKNQMKPEDDADGEERLQKLIARAGVASRRAAEELIRQGRVVVNGHTITELGFKADPVRDAIVVEGHPLKMPSGPANVVLLHKPKGVMTTKNDPEGRPTIMQLLPKKYAHLHPVGRLDYDTSGVLLLTDDGSLTQLLTHPSHGVSKVYRARVRGHVAPDALKRLESGVRLEDGKTAPCKARVRAQTEQNSLVEITLREGRNRQVRRMLEAVGHPALALRRVRFGNCDLEGLLPGAHRLLLPGEVHQLRKLAEKPVEQRTQSEAHKPARKQRPRPAPSPKRPTTPKRSATPKRPAAAQRPAAGRPAGTSAGASKKQAHPLAQRIERRWDKAGE